MLARQIAQEDLEIGEPTPEQLRVIQSSYLFAFRRIGLARDVLLRVTRHSLASVFPWWFDE